MTVEADVDRVVEQVFAALRASGVARNPVILGLFVEVDVQAAVVGWLEADVWGLPVFFCSGLFVVLYKSLQKILQADHFRHRVFVQHLIDLLLRQAHHVGLDAAVFPLFL
ncbi:hypothetical protein D3C84_904900 [compost metagenome]